MDARWMPILAATLGVIGGLAGALAGGFIANHGQVEEFKRDRAAARQDLRTDVYGEYLGTAEAYVLANLLGLTDAEKNAQLVKLFVTRARVFLVREDIEVEKAAEAITAAVLDDTKAEMDERTACEEMPTGGPRDACYQRLDDRQYKAYLRAGDGFLATARQEIADTAE